MEIMWEPWDPVISHSLNPLHIIWAFLLQSQLQHTDMSLWSRPEAVLHVPTDQYLVNDKQPTDLQI